MNPQQTQTAVTEWIGVAVVVIGLLINAYFTVKGKWDDAQHRADLAKELALQRQQMEQNTARLNGQSAKIDTIMLAAPPPNQPPSFAVAVSGGETTTSSDTTNPKEGQSAQAKPDGGQENL